MNRHIQVISLSILLLLSLTQTAAAQARRVQNRPYTDLRPLHFGIIVGANMQDTKFENIGFQTLTLKDGTQVDSNIAVEQDNWDTGFNVGVLAEMRLNEYFQFRIAPQMTFGSRNLRFYNYQKTRENILAAAEGAGQATLTEGEEGTSDPEAFTPSTAPVMQKQSLKTVYVGANIDLIFASKRFNNHRPYVMAGIAPMINLSTKANDYIQMKKYDVFFEVGMGCDLYLPFFKLRPELKFMMGLTNSLNTDHANELNNIDQMPYAACARSARSKMLVLSFYFE